LHRVTKRTDDFAVGNVTSDSFAGFGATEIFRAYLAHRPSGGRVAKVRPVPGESPREVRPEEIGLFDPGQRHMTSENLVEPCGRGPGRSYRDEIRQLPVGITRQSSPGRIRVRLLGDAGRDR